MKFTEVLVDDAFRISRPDVSRLAKAVCYLSEQDESLNRRETTLIRSFTNKTPSRAMLSLEALIKRSKDPKSPISTYLYFDGDMDIANFAGVGMVAREVQLYEKLVQPERNLPVGEPLNTVSVVIGGDIDTFKDANKSLIGKLDSSIPVVSIEPIVLDEAGALLNTEVHNALEELYGTPVVGRYMTGTRYGIHVSHVYGLPKTK